MAITTLHSDHKNYWINWKYRIYSRNISWSLQSIWRCKSLNTHRTTTACSRIQVVGVELKIKEHCVFKEVQPAQWCFQWQRTPNGTGEFCHAGGWSRGKQGFRDDRRIATKWNSRNVWSNWKLSSTIYRKSSIKSPLSNKPPPSNKGLCNNYQEGGGTEKLEGGHHIKLLPR